MAKATKNESGNELNCGCHTDLPLAKCVFCGGDVISGRGIEIRLTKTRLGGWQLARVKVHCCDACYTLISQEGRKAMLRWLSISLIAFIVMSVVLLVQFGGETPFGLRVVLGGMSSFWPTLLIMFLLSRLKGVVPDWHKKVMSHPVIAQLAMNGFRLPFRVKHVERGVPKAEEHDA